MAAYNNATEDGYSRQIKPVLFNTAKDGSGTWYFALVDSDGHLQVDQLSALPAGTNAIGKVGHDKTGIGHGVETVDEVGTDQPIVTSSTPAKSVIVQAQTDNTGAIAVGASGVDATVATGTGILLYAGDWTPPLEVDNLADVYIDATVINEGVRFIYFT